MQKNPFKFQQKILTKSYMEIISLLKRDTKKIVFTNGCFDILHQGHIHLLSNAKSLGDVLIVGINNDASIRRLKGANRPIINLESRAVILAALEMVDYIITFSEDTPLKLIQEIQPDVLVKGGDYTLENIVGYDIVLQNGGAVKIVETLEGLSTTDIEHKIQNNIKKS